VIREEETDRFLGRTSLEEPIKLVRYQFAYVFDTRRDAQFVADGWDGQRPVRVVPLGDVL
jgi:hypothetical protein